MKVLFVVYLFQIAHITHITHMERITNSSFLPYGIHPATKKIRYINTKTRSHEENK